MSIFTNVHFPDFARNGFGPFSNYLDLSWNFVSSQIVSSELINLFFGEALFLLQDNENLGYFSFRILKV